MHQRHPFSLTSAPDDEHLSMHIRSLGDWSFQMYSIFQEVFNFLSILREETVETEKYMMMHVCCFSNKETVTNIRLQKPVLDFNTELVMAFLDNVEKILL